MGDVDFAVLLHHLKWDLFPSSNDKECNIDSPIIQWGVGRSDNG